MQRAMVSIAYKKFGLKINSVWFCEDIQDANLAGGADIVFFHGIRDSGIKNSLTVCQKTMITNLNESLEEIFRRISSYCKNRISKAEREVLNLAFTAQPFFCKK